MEIDEYDIDDDSYEDKSNYEENYYHIKELEEYQKVAEQRQKSTAKKVAEEVNKKGRAEIEEEEAKSKNEHLLKKLTELGNALSKAVIRLNKMQMYIEEQAKDYQIMKKTTYDMDKLMEQIKNWLPNIDISQQDIDEIIIRTTERVRNELKDNNTSNNINKNKPINKQKMTKYIKYLASIIIIAPVLFFGARLFTNTNTQNKQLKGEYTIKKGAKINCEKTDKQFYFKKEVVVKGEMTGNEFKFVTSKYGTCITKKEYIVGYN